MKHALVLLAVLSSGCFHVGVTSPATDRGPAKEETSNYHILNGLTSAEVSAAECHDGMSKITYYHPWWSIFCLAPCTAGLVSATRVTYTCAEPKRGGGMETKPVELPTETAAVVSTFTEGAKLRDVLTLPEGAAFPDAWQRVRDALSRAGWTLQPGNDVLTSEWRENAGTKVRVRVEASPDKKKIAVMSQAQREGKSGGDADAQKALVEAVRAALKGP